MIYHFSVGVMAPQPEILRKLREYANRNPKIVWLDRGPAGAGLAFCASEQSANFERAQFARGGGTSPSICVATVDEYGIQINQECMEESRENMAAFVNWILGEFPSVRVFDDDAEAEITEQARSDPRFLFD